MYADGALFACFRIGLLALQPLIYVSGIIIDEVSLHGILHPVTAKHDFGTSRIGIASMQRSAQRHGVMLTHGQVQHRLLQCAARICQILLSLWSTQNAGERRSRVERSEAWALSAGEDLLRVANIAIPCDEIVSNRHSGRPSANITVDFYMFLRSKPRLMFLVMIGCHAVAWLRLPLLRRQARRAHFSPSPSLSDTRRVHSVMRHAANTV